MELRKVPICFNGIIRHGQMLRGRAQKKSEKRLKIQGVGIHCWMHSGEQVAFPGRDWWPWDGQAEESGHSWRWLCISMESKLKGLLAEGFQFLSQVGGRSPAETEGTVQKRV